MAHVQARREPRFIYLSEASPKGGDRGPAPTHYGWRLDAANHRTLARAASVSDSSEACRSAASAVRERIDEATTTVANESAPGLWVWRLDLDGVPVAVSPHAFARRVECARAYAQFLVALAVADPAAGVVRNFGPRALRAFGLRMSAL